jgi:hypothetical protein
VGQRRPRAGFDWTNSTRLQGGASTGSFQSFAGIRIDDAASRAPAKEPNQVGKRSSSGLVDAAWRSLTTTGEQAVG